MNATSGMSRRAQTRTALCLSGLAVSFGSAGLVLGAAPAGAAVSGLSAAGSPATISTPKVVPPWSIQTTANPSGNPLSVLDGVSCRSATACVAAGFNDTGTKLDALTEVWNGTSWKIPFIKRGDPLRRATGSLLNGVSCPSAKKCEAVGYYQAGAIRPLAVIWNGTLGRYSVSSQPSRVPSGATSAIFDAVSCTSAKACTATAAIWRSSGTAPPGDQT